MLPSLGGAKDAREEEKVSNNSPGAGLSPHGCFDVLQSFKGQIILGGNQSRYITDSSASHVDTAGATDRRLTFWGCMTDKMM